ncbi:DNA-binding helix-turn-helix protein [Clostridiales bacterium oral taxon 876 str. F0540]|nr:DNA-binding helix-turn-helix protein [Clostridiales bacterium oral taxon 876 str. F0540]
MGVKNRLKEIRMREFMKNSSEFANFIGISLSTYSQIESNKQQGNIETILKISTALNRKVEDIWYLED